MQKPKYRPRRKKRKFPLSTVPVLLLVLATGKVVLLPTSHAASAPKAIKSDTKAIPALLASSAGKTMPVTNLFKGGSDSLVAKAVGHAEGTRTPGGRKTSAYYGHTDPGNGVHNQGSFSYQHNARSPEEADEKQSAVLKEQAKKIVQKGKDLGIEMNLAEAANGIDLANQSPLAALDDDAYAKNLKKSKDKGLNGDQAILDARVQSFWDPKRQRWDAPGLGNTEAMIRHDQERRLLSVARALELAAKEQKLDVKTKVDPTALYTLAATAFSYIDPPTTEAMPVPPAYPALPLSAWTPEMIEAAGNYR